VPYGTQINEISLENVKKLFNDAWPEEGEYLADTIYYFTQTRLNIIAHHNNFQKKKSFGPKEFAALQDSYIKLGKSGRSFIAEIPAIRRYIEKTLSGIPEIVRLNFKEYNYEFLELKDMIDRINKAEDSINAVLALIRKPEQPVPDPVCWIADAARQAWEQSAVNVSVASDPAGPLTQFVVAVLAEMRIFKTTAKGKKSKDGEKLKAGQPYSAETVSDRLNNRRGGGGAPKKRPPKI
jgi:hypothetical protein